MSLNEIFVSHFNAESPHTVIGRIDLNGLATRNRTINGGDQNWPTKISILHNRGGSPSQNGGGGQNLPKKNQFSLTGPPFIMRFRVLLIMRNISSPFSSYAMESSTISDAAGPIRGPDYSSSLGWNEKITF